jgi:hypothetical protein
MHFVPARTGAFVVTLTACALLSGCGSTQLAATDAAGIHTIQLFGFAEPDYQIQGRFVLNTISMAPSDEVSFSSLLANNGLHLGTEMKAAIAQALRNDGYQIDDSHNADAVLEVKFAGAPPNFAPMYEAAAGPYEPEYSVDVALRDTKTNKKLFHQFYVYRDNSISPMDGTILLKPDPKFNFNRPEDFYKEPVRAADGFRAAIPRVAESVGTLVNKQH